MTGAQPSASCDVAVFIPLFPPAFRGGGPIRSAAALVSTAPPDMEVRVVTGDRDLGCADRLPVQSNVWQTDGRRRVLYVSTGSLRMMIRSLRAIRGASPALVHVNSFFNPLFSIIPCALWRCGFFGNAQLLVSPRGEFATAALLQSRHRKRLYIFCFRKLMRRTAFTWHATAPHEAEDLRRMWGGSARVLEHSDDHELPREAMDPVRAPGPIRLAFVSRIVDHKGLHILLAALGSAHSSVSLAVIGPREDLGYLRKCHALAQGVPEYVSVTWPGELDAADVRPALASYDALLLPTRGENFGHVIAEALSVSTLVVTTPLTPWSDVLAAGGGTVVASRSDQDWVEAIQVLAAMKDDEILERRQRAGRAYTAWASMPLSDHLWHQALAAERARSLPPR